MTRATLLFAMMVIPAARSTAQEATGSFIPAGATWKKGDVLRTSANVEQLHFSADSQLLLLAGQQGLSVWDWKNEKESSYFSFPRGTKLACLALSPDGKSLASGHVDSTRVVIWELAKGEVKVQLNHSAPVRALTYSPDGKQLASGGGHVPEEKAERDCFIQMWNLADGKAGTRYVGLDRPVRTISLAKDSVVAEDERGDVFVWSRVANKLNGRISTHSFVTPLAMIDGGRKLVGYEVGSGRFLTQWDSALEKKEQLIDMSPTNQGSRHGFWCNREGTLAATSHPGEIHVWDLKAKTKHCTLTIPREREVLALTFTPDSGEVVAALNNEMIVRLAVEKGK